MLEQQGIVISTDHNFATVQFQRTTGCGHCAAQQSCSSAGVVNQLGSHHTQVTVVNHSAVKVGDQVIIGLQEQALLKGSMLVYLVPLLCLLAGAIGYERIVTLTSWPHLELLSILSGLVGFTVGLIIVKRWSFKLSTDARYQPEILKVIH